MPMLKFGKYQGQDIEEVPDDYVDYMVKNNEDGLRMWKDEKNRRENEMRLAALKVDGSFMAKIIQAGRDHFINDPTIDQVKLELAFNKLMDALRDAAGAHKP